MFKKINIQNINYSDSKCSIAIIIPHQNKIENLKKLIKHLQDFKTDNRMDIYVIDQNNADKFNRGLLFNIGYFIAIKQYSYDRYIFHNVNYYPDEELFNLYFKFINDNIHFVLSKKQNFIGGVFGIKKEDFEKINGYPNNFFGDEAFYNRCSKNNLIIYRPTKGEYYIDEEINKYDNKLFDSTNNGLKQLINFFINIKKYSINDFISNYDIIDRNNVNNAESIQTFLFKGVQPITAFKIDYLSTHKSNINMLLNKDIVQVNIKKKLEIFKKEYPNQKYFQHSKHPEFISLIEPLIYIDEIQKKIFDTYTDIKPFIFNEKIIDKKEIKIKKLVSKSFERYDMCSKEDLFKTIKFIFETFNELLYFRIRNNKIECAYHLYNMENKIDWLKYVKTIDNKTIDEELINIMNSQNKFYYTLRKPHFLPMNNCLAGFDSYNYFEGASRSYIKEFKEMIEYTITKFKNIPDSDIIINRKDSFYITKDHKYAYDHLLIGDQAKIEGINKFYFIGSQSIKDNSLDIAIPSADEWKDIKKYKNIKNVKWKYRKQVAFFRGSSTGCGINLKTNKRLNLADISFQWSKSKDNKNLLDVALSHIASKVKIYNQFIGTIDQNKYNYLIGSFINSDEQLKYKYIFNIEGNAQAYRYATEFRKKAVILNVESDYHMWFEPLLKDGKHIIIIKGDYSNLLEKLQYLKENDDKAEKIAKSGYKFSKKYINEYAISTFWFYYMININNNTKNI